MHLRLTPAQGTVEILKRFAIQTLLWFTGIHFFFSGDINLLSLLLYDNEIEQFFLLYLLALNRFLYIWLEHGNII